MSFTTITTVTLTTTPISCLLANSWIFIWLMLEMNTLSYCSMLLTKKQKKNMEMSLKYYVIQTMGSTMLIVNACFPKEVLCWKMSTSLICLGIMLKMAAVPLHQWFNSMNKNLSNKSATLLMTWQKAAPLTLSSFIPSKMIMPFLVMTSTVGATSQMNKTNIMEIMSLSSVFNLAWMLTAMSMTIKITMTYCTLYWLTVIISMTMIYSYKLKKMTNEETSKTKKITEMMIMSNLAGIPPMLGFIPKWLVFNQMMKSNMKTIPTIILTTSTLNMYIYTRMILTKTLSSTKLNLTSKINPNQKFIYTTVMTSSMSPILIMNMLGNALNMSIIMM